MGQWPVHHVEHLIDITPKGLDAELKRYGSPRWKIGQQSLGLGEHLDGPDGEVRVRP
ncbi:hypothetical protein SSTU70S_05411 [Stutzerimonas stutzeri]